MSNDVSTPAKPNPCSRPNAKTSSRRQECSREVSEVFERDVRDRQRDQRFNNRGRQGHHTEQRQAKRHRMRQREGADLQQERASVRGEQEQSKDEKDVIQPMRQDVREAQADQLPEGDALRPRVDWSEGVHAC